MASVLNGGLFRRQRPEPCPERQHPDCGEEGSAKGPHDHAAELLILEGRQAPGPCRAETINGFYQSVTDRSMSLSKTHTLLVNDTWGGATIEDLFKVEPEACESGAMSLPDDQVEVSWALESEHRTLR